MIFCDGRGVYFIEHNGHRFASRGLSPNRHLIWPIEEYLVRRKHGREVADRIRRLNPDGKEEGSWPRGWHPHKRSVRYDMDLVSVRQFIERHGRAAHSALPRRAFYRDGHRKAIAYHYYAELG